MRKGKRLFRLTWPNRAPLSLHSFNQIHTLLLSCL
jgi:hypothetical protein